MIYRVTQESLSNIAQHAGARGVDVELSFVGRTLLRIRDDGARLRRPRRAAASTAACAAGPAASASPACASARCSSAAASTSSPRPARAPPSS